MVESEDLNEDKIKTEKRKIFTMKDYYSDDTENAVVMLQKRFRERNVVVVGAKKKIVIDPLKVKWEYIRDLKNSLNDDKAFKTQRLQVMWNYGFQIKGVKNMSNQEMFEMCVRALFISIGDVDKNRPKLKGIKWIDRY